MNSFSASSFGGNTNNSNINSNINSSNSSSSNDPVLGNSKTKIPPRKQTKRATAMPPLLREPSAEAPPPKKVRGVDLLGQANQNDHRETDRSPLPNIIYQKRNPLLLEILLIKNRHKQQRMVLQLEGLKEFEGLFLRELANETASEASKREREREREREGRHEQRSSSSPAPHQAPSPLVAEETTLLRQDGTTIARETGRKPPPPGSSEAQGAKKSKPSTLQKRKPGRKKSLVENGKTSIRKPRISSKSLSKQPKGQGVKKPAPATRETPKRKTGWARMVTSQEGQDDATKEPAPKRSRVEKTRPKPKRRGQLKDDFAFSGSSNESKNEKHKQRPMAKKFSVIDDPNYAFSSSESESEKPKPRARKPKDLFDFPSSESDEEPKPRAKNSCVNFKDDSAFSSSGNESEGSEYIAGA